MSSSMRLVIKTKQRPPKTKRKPGRNEYKNCHVVVLSWNTPIYQGLAHTVCMKLGLQNTNHKLVSLYPFSETSWTERYDVKGFAVLGCSGSDIHTPKTFCACVCFAPRVCMSAEARWWWDQSHLAWEVSSLKQTAALGWKQASCQSNCAGWRVDRWVSRVEHDTRNGWLTVVEAEEKSSSSFFRRMFLRGACHIYWKFHFKDQSGEAAEADRPHDRGDNVHLLSCRNSVYIMHKSPCPSTFTIQATEYCSDLRSFLQGLRPSVSVPVWQTSKTIELRSS